MRDKDYNVVNGSFNFLGNSIIFTPNEELKSETIYVLTMNKAIKDIYGKSLGLSQEIRFTTRSKEEATAPKPKQPTTFKVQTTLPSDGSTQVDINSKIILYFSDNVSLNTITKNSVKLHDSLNNETDITLKTTQNILTITPTKPMNADSSYRVDILKGIKDTQGNDLQPYSFSFETTKYKKLHFKISASKTNIVKGEEISFEAKEVQGEEPFIYEWVSDEDGALSDKKAFSTKTLSVGNHTIILRVSTPNGEKTQTIKISVTDKTQRKTDPAH